METIAILISVLVVLALLFLYFMYITTPKTQSRGKKYEQGMSPAQISARWNEVQAMMKVGGPANYKQSIMDADNLVDAALKSKVAGNTMGERLKNAKHLFSKNTYNDLWTAHKIRNNVAHEADFEGLSSEATLAVRNFEKALRELRAI